MQQFMFLQSATVVSLLVSTVIGWELTAYRDVDECNSVSSNEVYRVYTGTGSVGCQNLEGAATDGVSCGEYQAGGQIGPETCGDDGDDVTYRTIKVTLDGSTIDLYTSGGCDNGESPTTATDGCVVFQGDPSINGFVVS